MPAEAPKRIWALLGPHRGDNNQVLALAEALGLPFEVKSLRYNQLAAASTAAARRHVAQPRPGFACDDIG